VAISAGTFEPVVDTPSQLMSQYSGGSQYTPEQKFLHKSEILPLSKIILLPMVTKKCFHFSLSMHVYNIDYLYRDFISNRIHKL
jgi:hypothetical protein